MFSNMLGYCGFADLVSWTSEVLTECWSSTDENGLRGRGTETKQWRTVCHSPIANEKWLTVPWIHLSTEVIFSMNIFLVLVHLLPSPVFQVGCFVPHLDTQHICVCACVWVSVTLFSCLFVYFVGLSDCYNWFLLVKSHYHNCWLGASITHPIQSIQPSNHPSQPILLVQPTTII